MRAVCDVWEIFASIQGESTHAGRPCAFVRLAGCPFDCTWCDTVHARGAGRRMAIEEIVERVAAFRLPLVEVTGGEPLAQEGVYPLLDALLGAGFEVLLETSGLIDTARIPARVETILDVKPPSSGQSHRIVWENLGRLGPGDEVKIVVADRTDYDWMRDVLAARRELAGRTILASPAAGRLDPSQLAAWI
ncbi:MAG: radical SAM protein, partial [Planctomycetes bacterium]|nr:radical SAM protein [Planctomycetota bacterium]